MKKISKNLIASLSVGLLFASVSAYADQAANQASLSSATGWLLQQQNPDGSWGSDENVRYLNTSSVVNSLKASNNYNAAYYAGIAWLENHSAGNVDYISRKIDSLYSHGNNISDDTSYLLQAKRDIAQQGWGLSSNYTSSSIDSAIALSALLTLSDTVNQASAINYLISSQLADGGWSLNNTATSDAWITAYIHSVLATIPAPSAAVTTALANSSVYLDALPTTSTSLVLAQTSLALFRTQGLSLKVDGLITELLLRQTVTGDWGDLHTTATATRMLSAVLGMDTDAFAQSAGITDQTLRSVINAQLGKNAFDNIVDGELQQITQLDLRNTDVANLVGLAAAINLTTVYVNANTDTSALAGVTVIVDSDSDGIVEASDNCPLVSNADQANLDGDAFGDVCDADADGDGFTVAQGDWNDFDNTLYPGAPEICGDGIDQDGNGVDLPCYMLAINPVAAQSVQEAATLTVPLSVVDTGGNIITYSIISAPSFMALFDNGDGTAALNVTPGYDKAGNYAVTVSVVDNGVPSQTSSLTFNVDVKNTYSAYQYTALNPRLVNGAVNVVSLSDNNIIQAGNTTLNLSRNQSAVIPAGELVQGTTVTGSGAFDISGSIDVTDMLVPSKYAGTQFVIPHYRSTHTYYMQSPEGDAVAQIQVGVTPYTVNLPQGQVVAFAAGADNTVSGVISSDMPILVSHLGSTNADTYAVPPAALEIWGLRSTQAFVGALQSNTNVTIYAQDGSTSSVILNAGQRYTVVNGVTAAQGESNAYHIVADKPIAAAQGADSDGLEQASYMRTEDLATHFGIPTNAQYIAVVCPTAGTIVTLFDGLGVLISQQTCLGNGPIPGKAYFGSAVAGANIAAGAYLEADYPIAVIYEDSLTNDERNLLGYTVPVNQYTALNPSMAIGAVNVVSLSDNNVIHAGNTTLNLNRNQSAVIPAGELVQGTKITGSRAFDISGSIDATDMPAPNKFAGTQFVIPHYRYTHTYYMQSPEGDAVAQIQVGLSAYTVNLPQGQVIEFVAGADNTVSGVITTDLPVLVSHRGNTNADTYAVPPAALEIWGLRSTQAFVGALQDNTNVSIYAQDGSTSSVILNAGQRYTVVNGVSAAQGESNAYHIVADKPIAAAQGADSDGLEQASYMRTEDLATHFGIPTNAQYIAVVCPTAGTIVTLFDSLGVLSGQQTCLASGTFPGKAYFGNAVAGVNIAAGTILEADYPVAVIYEDSATNDERNLLGVVANRLPTIVDPGAQTNIVSDVINLQIVATDPDTSALAYSATGLPTGLSIDLNTGLISGTVTTVGSYTATVMVLDRDVLNSINIIWTIN